MLLYFFGWGDVVLAEECSFPKRKPAHTPTSFLPTYLTYLFLFSNFSFFINSLHQHHSTHIDLQLNILLCSPLSRRLAQASSRYLAPLSVPVREARCGSESKDLELQESINPELGIRPQQTWKPKTLRRGTSALSADFLGGR